MSTEQKVAEHYAHADLVAIIRDGLEKIGKTPATVTEEDLAGIDEFHIGGRQATEEFLARLGFSAAIRMLDVGCGIGGARPGLRRGPVWSIFGRRLSGASGERHLDAGCVPGGW